MQTPRNSIYRKLEDNLAKKGYIVQPYFLTRSPVIQAELWRQSREKSTIQKKIAYYRGLGCEFLAHCMETAKPSTGPWATNAGPGESWHQFTDENGLTQAVDYVWIVNGKMCWDTNGYSGYHALADEAEALGLVAGGHWPKKDWCHVQIPKENSPTSRYSLKQIDQMLGEQYGFYQKKNK